MVYEYSSTHGYHNKQKQYLKNNEEVLGDIRDDMERCRIAHEEARRENKRKQKEQYEEYMAKRAGMLDTIRVLEEERQAKEDMEEEKRWRELISSSRP